MSALDQLEGFLQDLLERPAWLLSARRLQPAQLAGAIARQLEEGAVRLADRIVVPDTYTVTLAAEDFAQVASAGPELERQLAEYVERLAVERALFLARDPQVRLRADNALKPGRIAVRADRPLGGRPEWARPSLQGPGGAVRTGGRAGPAAALTLLGATGERVRTFPLSQPAVRIGRRSDNDISLADLKVSRHHVELREIRREWYANDIGSTNGTRINGEPLIGRRKLRSGDIIELGLQRLRYER